MHDCHMNWGNTYHQELISVLAFQHKPPETHEPDQFQTDDY